MIVYVSLSSRYVFPKMFLSAPYRLFQRPSLITPTSAIPGR